MTYFIGMVTDNKIKYLVYVDGLLFGDLHIDGEFYVFHAMPYRFTCLQLKDIADKLAELNGPIKQKLLEEAFANNPFTD